MNTRPIRTKYRVDINWCGEVHKLYTVASTENAAKGNAIRQLAKKVGYSSYHVGMVLLNKPSIDVMEVDEDGRDS